MIGVAELDAASLEEAMAAFPRSSSTSSPSLSRDCSNANHDAGSWLWGTDQRRDDLPCICRISFGGSRISSDAWFRSVLLGATKARRFSLAINALRMRAILDCSSICR